MHKIIPFMALLLITAAASCTKKTEAPTPPPPLPKTFSFTDTNVLVSSSEIDTEENEKKSLQADFNLDGLSDMAIIKANDDVQNEVDIFIQASKPAAAQKPGKPLFYRGGTIRRPEDGKIIGLMSGTDGRMVNIILLITYTNRPNALIHYRNDGTSFTEVPEKSPPTL